MAESEVKVPTIVATSIICLLVGAGIGMLGMSIYYDNPRPVGAGAISSLDGASPAAMPESAPPAGGPPASGPPGGPPGSGPAGGPGGGPSAGAAGMPGGGPPGKGGGGRGPSPKIQLASLVAKLDLLSQKPLTISLDDGQKKKVQDQLKGLEAKESLSDEEAKERLDALLEVLKDQKETLESAGYRWPGQGGFRPPADTPNPFKDEKNGKSLKSLQDHLAK